MKKTRHRKKQISDINVVPYIDVMLVLLIIFMITTPLLSQGVKVDLPKATAKALPNQNLPPIIISVDASNHYFSNIAATPTAPINAVDIQAEISDALSKNPDRKIYVRADQSVGYGDVVTLMALLQQAGAASIGLMTDNPNQTRQSP